MGLGQVAANMGKHVLCVMDDLRDHAGYAKFWVLEHFGPYCDHLSLRAHKYTVHTMKFLQK